VFFIFIFGNGTLLSGCFQAEITECGEATRLNEFIRTSMHQA